MSDVDSGRHRRLRYAISVEEDRLDGGWVVECTSLPGCASQGASLADALANIADAIDGVEATLVGREDDYRRARGTLQRGMEPPEVRIRRLRDGDWKAKP